MMNKSVLLVVALGGLTSLIGCASSPVPSSEQDKASLSAGVEGSLARFNATDPGLKAVLDKSAGYAVLPDVGKGGLIIGAGYGSGEVFEEGKKIGYCDHSQGSFGAQVGGQAYSELIVFKDKSSLASFKTGEFTFAANATAVLVKPGAAATMNYSDGVAVLIHVKGGAMVEASIGGQKLRYQPLK